VRQAQTACFLVAAALVAASEPARAEPAPEAIDLLVRGGTLVTMDAELRIIPKGAVAVSAGQIVGVGPESELSLRFEPAETLDAAGGLIVPGLINAHTHAPMVLFRGIADDLRLMSWLQDYIFPAEAKNVTPAFVRAGTRLAAVEMIRSGTTTFVDMYYFEDEVAQAAKEAGMRAVVGETLIGFAAPDNKTIAEALMYTERFLKRWADDPLIVPAVAPHSTYLTSPDALSAARALADRYGAPLLIHLSESPDEQAEVLDKYQKTPTQHLADLGFLRKGVLGAHGIWLDEDDRALLKQAEVGIAHCPQSNMKTSAGAAPVGAMLEEGLRLGLGTDGSASNNDLDMFEEMLTAALLAKHATGDPTVAPARQVLAMATIGGARALGMEDRLGSLEVGKRADLIVVDLSAPRLTPLYDPISHLVYATKGADVRHSVIDGRIVMRDRTLLTLDEDAVLDEARRLQRQVQQSLSR